MIRWGNSSYGSGRRNGSGDGSTSRKLDALWGQRLGRILARKRTRSEVSGSESRMVMARAGSEHGEASFNDVRHGKELGRGTQI